MEARELLFKLRLCRGIGYHGEHQVYKWIKRSKKQRSDLKLSIDNLIKIANVSKRFGTLFKRDYQSRSLKLRIRKNRREKWFCILDSTYPQRLRESNYPPNVIFYRGKIELLRTRCLGVVGARKNSQYSIDAMNRVLPPVIKKGLTIVAGLAEGVDSLGHQCALANYGTTIAVIGTGLDRIYPRFHHDLQKHLEKNQLVITEYPLGTPPIGYHFPARNRIIAGLVETIMIVEAKQKSGSLITANLALEDNRNVTAIPGSITSPLSNGCNELIQEGAKPICCAKDILEEFLI